MESNCRVRAISTSLYPVVFSPLAYCLLCDNELDVSLLRQRRPGRLQLLPHRPRASLRRVGEREHAGRLQGERGHSVQSRDLLSEAASCGVHSASWETHLRLRVQRDGVHRDAATALVLLSHASWSLLQVPAHAHSTDEEGESPEFSDVLHDSVRDCWRRDHCFWNHSITLNSHCSSYEVGLVYFYLLFV